MSPADLSHFVGEIPRIGRDTPPVMKTIPGPGLLVKAGHDVHASPTRYFS
jgi:hypothetical protein